MESIPIDRIIYQTLENIFEAQVKKLAIDIAKTLSVDVSEMRCKHLVPSSETPTLLVSCSNPVLWSSTPGTSMNVCVEHTHANLSGLNLPEWRYIPFRKI